MAAIDCRFCRLGTRDKHTGECNHCGRPLAGPDKVPLPETSDVAVEGQPCPTCGRKVPISGATRARQSRERNAATAASGTDGCTCERDPSDGGHTPDCAIMEKQGDGSAAE